MQKFLALGVAVFLSACTSTHVNWKQRAYVDSHLLSDEASSPGEGRSGTEKPRASLVRSIDYPNGGRLSVIPVTKSMFVQEIEEEAFRKRLPKAEVEKLVAGTRKYWADRTCFTISVGGGPTHVSADLDTFYFALVSGSQVLALKPVDRNDAPEKEIRTGSYTTGGYGSQIGNTFYYTPSTTHVYSYAEFSNDNIFCAAKKVDLTKGFSVLVDARFEKGDVIEDLVWTTNPSEAKFYRIGIGFPMSLGTSEGDKWYQARQKENAEKFAKAYPVKQ